MEKIVVVIETRDHAYNELWYVETELPLAEALPVEGSNLNIRGLRFRVLSGPTYHLTAKPPYIIVAATNLNHERAEKLQGAGFITPEKARATFDWQR